MILELAQYFKKKDFKNNIKLMCIVETCYQFYRKRFIELKLIEIIRKSKDKKVDG